MRAAWTASIQLRSRRSYSRARSFQWFGPVPRVAGRDGSMRLTGQRIAPEGTEPARTGLGTSVTMHDEPVGLHRTFGRGFTGPECIRSARKISCCPVSALCSSALATAPSGQRCAGAAALRQPASGGVAEWPKALVLKTSEPRGSVGSNPTPTANICTWMERRQDRDFLRLSDRRMSQGRGSTAVQPPSAATRLGALPAHHGSCVARDGLWRACGRYIPFCISKGKHRPLMGGCGPDARVH